MNKLSRTARVQSLLYQDPVKRFITRLKSNFRRKLYFRHSYRTPFCYNKKGGETLSGQNASTANLLDLLFGNLGEEPGLDDNGLLGQVALAQNLEVTSSGDVNDGSLLLVVGVLGASLLGDQGPQLIDIDGGAELVHLVGVNVEVPHADLEKYEMKLFN